MTTIVYIFASLKLSLKLREAITQDSDFMRNIVLQDLCPRFLVDLGFIIISAKPKDQKDKKYLHVQL